MIWLTWRQFRAQAAVVYVAVAALAVFLAVTGPGCSSACHADGSVFDQLSRATERALYHRGFVAMAAGPGASSAPSGAHRWSPASWRPAPTGSCGTRA